MLRRLTTWYLSPSGMLLALSLLLFAVFFLASGLTDSTWPAWFGVAATAVMGIFLPYRFSRQEGTALNAVREIGMRHDRLLAQLAKEAQQRALEAERVADEQAAKAKRESDDNVVARLLWLEQRYENTELRLEQRLSKLEE